MSAEQPSEESKEQQQSDHVTSSEESATNQDSSNQQQQDSSEETQQQHDHSVGENSTELEKLQQISQQQEPQQQESQQQEPQQQKPQQQKPQQQEPQQQEPQQQTNNIINSQTENYDQNEQHSIEQEEASRDSAQPSESEKQQPEEHMDDDPPSLEAERQFQKEKEEDPQPTAEPCDSTEKDAISIETPAEENMEVAAAEDDKNKGEEVAMETNVEHPQSTPETSQPSNEVADNEHNCITNDNQSELMPAVKDSHPEIAEKEVQPQDAVASKEEDKTAEQVTNKEISGTEAAEKDRLEEVTPSEDVQPVKDRVAAESFTLELDEDPLGNSSIFMDDEPSNEVLVDPDTSPPVSKKRKGKPRKLGTRTARSKVLVLYHTCDRVYM